MKPTVASEKNAPTKIREPVLRWLLSGYLVLLTVFVFSVLWMYWKQDRNAHENTVRTIQQYVSDQENSEARTITTFLEVISSIEALQNLFLANDRTRLYETSRPLYERLLQYHQTWVSGCLRLKQPEKLPE